MDHITPAPIVHQYSCSITLHWLHYISPVCNKCYNIYKDVNINCASTATSEHKSIKYQQIA